MKPNDKPWKSSNNHTYYCDDDIHRLPVKCLHNSVIYRMNLLPRSYDERVKADVHNKGFKLSSNSIGNFGEVDERFQTKEGRERLLRSISQFNEHTEKHRLAEMHAKENKRHILAARTEKRWAYSKNQGDYLGTFQSDPNYLFKKTLDPLDKTEGRIQTDAFKRTARVGNQFRPEVGSVI